MYTEKDTVRSMYDESVTDNEGCVAILAPNYLKEKYQKEEYQLFYLQSGFGCKPSTIGNACFGLFCIDAEETRINRYNFIGIANEETTKKGLEMLDKALKKLAEQ